jgi:CRP-like cAMP-binding protein
VVPLIDPRDNQLLACLPPLEYGRLLRHLEPMTWTTGEVLCESGENPPYVYFPTSAIVSLQYVSESGGSPQIAAVGFEGVVGISVFMGGNTTPSRAVVQSAGQGLRLSASRLLEEFNLTGPLLHLFLRYTQALITEMAQTAVCNRYHSMDQQLCRWLLSNLDRQRSNELVMTQSSIAAMLGFRRESISEAASRLDKAGVIRYQRGHIIVLDRPKLELSSCECYELVKKECARLLPIKWAI